MTQAASHPEPQSFTSAERRVSMIAVMVVFFLSALDQTVVSTAMPRASCPSCMG